MKTNLDCNIGNSYDSGLSSFRIESAPEGHLNIKTALNCIKLQAEMIVFIHYTGTKEPMPSAIAGAGYSTVSSRLVQEVQPGGS